MIGFSRLAFCAFAFLVAIIGAAAAGELPAPTGKVVLKVGGAISNTNAPGEALFDIEGLEALGIVGMRTSTPWTKGVHLFEGVRLSALLKAVGAQGEALRGIALNDYSAQLPIADSVASAALVAYRLDGKRMSIRDKGPLWIVFPYDTDSRLVTDEFLNRSIWQLKEIVVE